MTTLAHAPAATAVMINLGSGLQQAPGWINYDRSRAARLSRNPVARRVLRVLNGLGAMSKSEFLEWPDTTRVHDLTKGIPHESGSVDVVYSSHFLEHLWPDDARALLAECHRVLRPGGFLRIVVPDLGKAATAYVEGDRPYFTRGKISDETIPLADALLVYLSLRPSPRKFNPLEKVVRRFLQTDEGGHRWMYDADSLTARLREAGFTEVREVGYQEGDCTPAAALDKRPEDSLHLEARR